MTPLRKRMIQDMELAGLAVRTRGSYIAAVRRLAEYYRRSPDLLSEEQVRSYLIDLREQGLARGTFKHNRHGIQFLYCHTLGYDWPLFSKKRFVRRDRDGYRWHSPISKSAACSLA
jgi:hypothetical protein